MTCPYCQGEATQALERTTALGYRLSRCRPCRRTCNERTGTPFNHLQLPTDMAWLVVLWRLRYTLSRRDLAELFRPRGAGLQLHARGRPGLGSAFYPAGGGTPARQAMGQSGPTRA